MRPFYFILFKSFLIWAFVIPSLVSFAQYSSITVPKFKQSRNGEKVYEDSLKQVGKYLEKELASKSQNAGFDSLRIQLYAMMSEVYVDANRYNLDTAFVYADKLYIYAKKYNKKRLMMDALFRKELKYSRLHQYSESLKLCFEANELCDQLGKECGQRWKIEQIMGNIFLYSDDYSNAEKYITQSLASINTPGSNVRSMLSVDKGFLHGTLGKVYQRWKKGSQAENQYIRQLELMQVSKWDAAIANASEELGDFYNSSGNPNKALPYYDEALKINIRNNNEEGIATVYNSMADVNLNLKNYKAALDFANKSLTYAKKNRLSLLMPFTYNIIYKSNLGLNNELEALRANQRYWLLKDSNDLKRRIIDLGDVRRLYELDQVKIQREKERLEEEYRISSLQKQYELSKLKSEKLVQ